MIACGGRRTLRTVSAREGGKSCKRALYTREFPENRRYRDGGANSKVTLQETATRGRVPR